MPKLPRCWETEGWKRSVSTVRNDFVTFVENFEKRFVVTLKSRSEMPHLFYMLLNKATES